MSTMVERLAKAILEEIREGGAFVDTIDDDLSCLVLVDGDVDMLAVARAAIEAMMEPTEEQLDAVRHLVQWHTFGRPTEVALVRHCSALRKEPPEGCGSVDHVPPTNMVSYWIFQGIIQAALKDPE